MRGKLYATEGVPLKYRITPAGAGKTGKLVSAPCRCQDHPRRCGENRLEPSRIWKPTGSPPQVRGKRHKNTTFAEGTEDHPRRCGENCTSLVFCCNNAGSPPQVRGKHWHSGAFSRLKGITPAGAGKTASLLHRCSPPQDHPRRCGENTIPTALTLRLPGSPPQVRGKLFSYGIG